MTLDKRRRIWALAALSILVAVACYGVLNAGALPLIPSKEQVLQLDLWEGTVFSLLWFVVLALKAWRWHWQLDAVGHVPLPRVFASSLLGQTAVLMMPLRSGELVRPALISRNSPIPFWAALSTSATERIADSLFASVLLIVSLALADVRSPLPDHIGELPVPASLVPTLGYSAGAVTLVAIVVVLAFYYFRDPSIALLRMTLGKLSPAFGEWVSAKLTDLGNGLQFLSSSVHTVRYLLISAAYWGAHLLSTWWVFLAVGFPDLTLVQAGVVLGTLAFGMSMPNSPGFFGIYQVSAYASLAIFFDTQRIQSDGSGAVFWLYVLELGWILLLTPPAIWLERRWTANAVPGPDTVAPS